MPFVDARPAENGSRVHAVLGTPPSPGTCISLRVSSQRNFSLQDCVASGALTPGAGAFLSRMIEAKLAFLDQVVALDWQASPAFGLSHTKFSRPQPVLECRPGTLISTVKLSRPMSKVTMLAAGKVTISGSITVELHESAELPAATLINWPPQPSASDPRSFPFSSQCHRAPHGCGEYG